MFAFMTAKQITVIAAVLTTAAVAIATAPAAMATARTGAARGYAASASPQAEPAFTCPVNQGILCLHVMDWSGNYHWYQYYKCGIYNLSGKGVATWYVNNETPGTRATFIYKMWDGLETEWQTPPAKSGVVVNGPIPVVDFDSPYEVRPC